MSDAGPVTHTAATTAADASTVLDVELEGDRVLARVDQGDVSVLVEAPAGIANAELETVLEEVPMRLERTVALFDEGEQ